MKARVTPAKATAQKKIQQASSTTLASSADTRRQTDTLQRFKAMAANSPRTRQLRSMSTMMAATVQLKSKFNSISPKKSGAATPLKTLHDQFGPLMTAAGLPSQYSFHTALPNIAHNDALYAGANWDKAGSVDAELDSASRSKADGNNRNNAVIRPYGHFGVMERAILGRPDRGNTYDGGHMVEHTLMEAQDADVHGNLAPQENKNFNQGLMRGWESIPERYMDHHNDTWTYKVQLTYTDDSYQRTGAELIEAGVIPKMAETNLALLSKPRDKELTGKSVTFERWVPLEWKATLERTNGNDFPVMSLTHGAHMHNLMSSHASAQNEVYSTSLIPPLVRTNSGTLSGFIPNYGMMSGSTNMSMVGGTSNTMISSFMYQPVPQPFAFQPFATSTPSGKTPVVIPPTSQTVNRLTQDVSLNTLQTELCRISLWNANTGRKIKDPTIVRKAKIGSPEFMKLNSLFANDIQRAAFIKGVHKFSSTLTKMGWPTVVNDLNSYHRGKLMSLLNDPRLKV